MKFIFTFFLLFTLSFCVFAQQETTIKMYCGPTFIKNKPLVILVFKKRSYVLKRDLHNAINPNVIETINVIKDAAATALYGNRAVYGVIVITVKKEASKIEYKRLKKYFEKL